MRCPKCNSTRVGILEHARDAYAAVLWERLKCADCKHIWEMEANINGLEWYPAKQRPVEIEGKSNDKYSLHYPQ